MRAACCRSTIRSRSLAAGSRRRRPYASPCPATSLEPGFPRPWRGSASAGRAFVLRQAQRALKTRCAGCVRATSILRSRLQARSLRSKRSTCGSTRRRGCDFVFTSRSIASLEAAVLAGLGIMVLPRSRVQQTSLSIWEDAPLPELPQLYCGIYLRQGGNRAALEELAEDIAAVLRPQLQVRTGGAEFAQARASGSGQ